MEHYQYVIKPIKDLIPYARNSKIHTDKQVNQIASSMKEFGFTNPVLIDEDNGVIAGHGRILAAEKLKYEDAPCVILSGLTEAQKRAYVIADNKIAENAGWDEEMLKLEIMDLGDLNFDLELLGFDDDELSELLDIDADNDGNTDPDEVPEPPVVPISKPGDIWILGDHRLMCGDSTDMDEVMKLLEGIPAEMVHTDPPYGISYSSNWREKHDKFNVIKNDDVFLDIAPVINKCSKGWVFVWTSWKVITKWIDMLSIFGYPTNQIIWFKGGGGIGDLKKTFSSDYETALVWHRGCELTGERIGSVWRVDKDSASSYIHPTQKPVSLAVEAIEKTTNKNNTVLDLFGGSGSTLIACEITKRKSRLMELDEKYVDVIINRWQDFTGNDAVHADTGKTYNEAAHMLSIK